MANVTITFTDKQAKLLQKLLIQHLEDIEQVPLHRDRKVKAKVERIWWRVAKAVGVAE